VDENQDLAMEYGIMSIPTIVMIKDGKAVKNLVGVRDKNEIKDTLKDIN
jgi:thioredoxin 1